MKKIIAPVICLMLTGGMLTPRGWAQDHDKAPVEEKSKKQDRTGISVKVLVVFSEYDGDKKVKSLPYTISLNAMRSGDTPNPASKLRMGTRVPISTGNGQLTYLDVGTNIDCRAVRDEDGRYSLQLSLERSSVDGEAITQNGLSKNPITAQFRSDLNITVRDGETVESTVATDPINGKVTKVQVTLTSVK